MARSASLIDRGKYGMIIIIMIKTIKSNTSLDEPQEKRELQQTISEKEKLLIGLVEEIECLKIDLSVVRQEYNIKIGRLYLKLDETDLEILKFKKIEDLTSSGFPFKEAQKLIEETLGERHKQFEKERRKLDHEEKDIEKRKIISKEEQGELKKLFYKLAHKFHPDLTGGDDLIMKKINKAYADGDLEILRTIEQNGSIEDGEIKTIEELKNKLAKLEKSIEKMIYEQEQLKQSEWSILKKSIDKAKKQKRNLLDELADKLLTDIAEKENKLIILKKKHGRG